MDKFVDSFSRGLKKTKIPKTKTKNSGGLHGTQHQMFLDLGQKLFGKNKECLNCGMFFVIGDVDDERRHDQVCAKAREGPMISSIKGYRKLLENFELKCERKAIIIEIRNKQNSFSESVTKILKVVENELGSPPDYLTEGNQTVYLCIIEGTKSVIGCLVAEEVQPDDLYMLSSTVSATDISLEIESSCGGLNHRKKYLERLEPSDIQEICRNETESHFVFSEATRRYESSPLARKRTRGTDHQDRPLKGTLGVRQIWVNESHRRGSIARALVDTAREHFAYGTVVMRPHIAFSQPTSDGLKFALAYSQQETIWAYA